MAKIFISYSRDSQDVVEELVQDLHDDGHETWFDQRLTGGQQWWDKILSEIRECDIFVAALTPDSLESLACQRELKYADGLQKPLCPVRLSDKVRPEALPHRLAELQWVDYCHRDKPAFKNLQRTIRGLPKAPPLPETLPDLPAVPMSYLSTLRERIKTDSELEPKDQVQLVFDLRRHFRDSGPAEEIIDLLQRLKKRDEVRLNVGYDIDELLGEINRGQRGSVSSTESVPLDWSRLHPVIPAAVGDKKVEVAKAVHAATGLGLKEAKDPVEAAPKPVMEGATKEEAEKIKAALEKKAGAKVELKSNDTLQEDHEDQVRRAGPDNKGATGSRTVTRELVMAVAAELVSMDRTWYAPDIPVDKANNARASMKMPADESMLVLFDDTYFRSGKNCLVIGVTGLYYNYARSPGYASWEEFLANSIEVKKHLLGNISMKVAGRSWSFGVAERQVSTFLMKLRVKALDGL